MTTAYPIAQPAHVLAAIGPRIVARMAAKVGRVPDLSRDRRSWIEGNLLIRDKQRQLVKLHFNRVQREIWSVLERKGFRGIRMEILKGRQFGISTEVEAFMFEDTVRVPNTATVIISKDADETRRKLRMMRLYWQGLPDSERPALSYDSANEMVFSELGSSIYIGAAGHRSFGRGDTIHNAHCSETAYWPDLVGTLTGLQEAVPADGNVILEYTAHGAGTASHKHWLESSAHLNSYDAVFLAWPKHEEYAIASDLPLEPLLDPIAKLEEDGFRAAFNATDAQVRWRREKRKALGEKYDQEYPETAELAFLLSGRPRFDVSSLRRLQQLLMPKVPVAVELSGALKIYELPVAGHHYGVGADPAEGLVGGDFCAAYVVDQADGHEVAALHGSWATHVFGDLLTDLAKRYNKALLGVERNNHGHAVLQRIVQTNGYGNVYMHTDYDMAGHQRQLPGWPETVKTKPILETHLDELIRQHPECFADPEFVTEAFGYVYHDDGKTGANAGGHDDRVIARGIAHEMFALRPGYMGYLLDSTPECSSCHQRYWHPIDQPEATCPNCGTKHTRGTAAA